MKLMLTMPRILADHPHGGGRGKSKGNNHPTSPWGIPVSQFPPSLADSLEEAGRLVSTFRHGDVLTNNLSTTDQVRLQNKYVLSYILLHPRPAVPANPHKVGDWAVGCKSTAFVTNMKADIILSIGPVNKKNIWLVQERERNQGKRRRNG